MENISKKKGTIGKKGPLYSNFYKKRSKALIEHVNESDRVVWAVTSNINEIFSSTGKAVNQLTPIEKMAIAKSGVSKSELEKLKSGVGLDYEILSKALAVTRATLINKKGGEKFNLQVSERIVGLADLYSYGYDVFEDEERFNKWMFTPNKALGGEAPYELLDNQFGREEVRNIIGRIDYGVYS
jgi:putative toxin-antitoxin system antitoxin component (TIGR02293 family)